MLKLIYPFALKQTQLAACMHFPYVPTERGDWYMKRLFGRVAADQSGVTAIEYGLIAGLIAVVIIAAVTTVGTSLSGKFNAVAANLS
jgi:pilus assembly protein Flp/PilA